MRVVGVRIRDYRGIDDITLPLAPLTVLVGSNGAGKSSILEAMGYRTHEDGALGRLRDNPPTLEWYIGPARTNESKPNQIDARGLSTHLREASVDADGAINNIQGHLAVHHLSDGTCELALNLFELVLDLPAPRQVAVARTVRGAVRPVAAANTWASIVVQHLDAIVAGRPNAVPFIDLGVTVPDTWGLPSRTSMVASPDDISPVLLRCVGEVGRAVFAPLITRDEQVAAAFDALAEGRLGPLRDVRILDPVRRVIENATLDVLPEFIRRVGRPTIEEKIGPDTRIGEVLGLLDGLDTHTRKAGEELVAAIRAALASFGDTSDWHLDSEFIEGPDQGTSKYEYSRLGTGYRRWVCGAIDEASRLVTQSYTEQPLTAREARLALAAPGIDWRESRFPTPPQLSVRLIDEPVESLEPRVHSDVLNWLRERVDNESDKLSGRETLVLSTHHASLLTAGKPEDTEVIGVYRKAGKVQVVPVGPTLLEGLRKNLEKIKLSRAELLFSARGLLLVEGSDDAEILHALYGEDLGKRGILVHPIGGSDHVAIKAAFQHTAYHLLALPTWVLLDKVPEGTTPPAFKRAAKELQGEQVLNLLPFEGIDMAFGPNPEAYRATARGWNRCTIGEELGVQSRNGDNDIYRIWESKATSADAKKWITEQLGLSSRSFASKLVPRLAHTIAASGNPKRFRGEWLEATMQRFFHEFDNFKNPGLFESSPTD